MHTKKDKVHRHERRADTGKSKRALKEESDKIGME